MIKNDYERYPYTAGMMQELKEDMYVEYRLSGVDCVEEAAYKFCEACEILTCRYTTN